LYAIILRKNKFIGTHDRGSCWEVAAVGSEVATASGNEVGIAFRSVMEGLLR
jgi:hypothetical protein